MDPEDRDERRERGGSESEGARARGLASVDPAAEDDYWRRHWNSRPYTDRDRDYEHYRPAYRLGWESRHRYPDRSWEELEPHLANEWDRHRDRGRASLKWDEARLAARDAWRRLEQKPGDTGR